MTICVVYGSTPEGTAALALAVRESRLRGSALVALATERQQRFEADETTDDSLRREITAQLRDVAGPDGVEARVEVVDDGGDAAAAVLELAVAQEAELLVVGVKRRSPVGKLFLGSVAQQIILESPIPVLVTHAAR